MNGIVTAFLFIFSAAQDDAAKARESIRADDLKAHVQALASDEMGGRNAGTPEGEKAAQYVAERFKEYGLRPLADGTYLQPFDFAVRNDGERKTTLLARRGRTANVVGILPGGDEAVVVGAHYDHCGKRGQWNPGRRNKKKEQGGDDVWNGADDNASGTAALLELAQAFSALKPRRTIVFVAFGAEEHGLLGSEWYSRNPAAALDRTVLMVNLDMIGRDAEGGAGIHGAGTAEGLRARVEEAAKESELAVRVFDFGDIREPDSDHMWFFMAGVPSLLFFNGLHEDYHESTDHADKLNYGSMEKISRTAFRVLLASSEAADRPAFRPARRLGIVDTPIGERDAENLRLPKGAGALFVLDVLEGSAAASAGLQKEDFILAFNGTALPLHDPRRELHRLVDAAPAGKELPMVVFRANKRMELKVEFK
ncbi:MAG: M20/M25/M40 family metallo-hydrolase [Planctomycetes bacterium]|nr:M20/M25/M40 family metallo-hydrolase [Planctomycetota bacterium]